MKRRYLFIIIGFITQMVYSETFFQRIEADLQNGQISEIDAAYLKGIHILDPNRLPEEYRLYTERPIKSGFATHFLIHHYWEEFSATQKTDLSLLYYRPVRDHSIVSPNGKFRIHYSLSGYHAVSLEDLDLSGIPDYVEKTAQIIDSVYSIEVEQMGFQPPPHDEEEGPEWDIYISNIVGYYGWTQPDALVSTNPDIWTSHVEVDNNYTHTDTKGLNGLRVTLAHEFFHMIHFGYNARNEDNNGLLDDQFYWEAGATWMEDAVYDDINDYYNYLDQFFKYTNRRFDRFDEAHEYGLCLWFHYLEKRFESNIQKGEMVRKIWKKIIEYPALQATDYVLREMGKSFNEELPNFYGWNYMTGSRADTVNFYPEGTAYPEISLDGTYLFSLDTTIVDDLLPTACRYYQFTQSDGTRFTLIPTHLDWETGLFSRTFSIGLMYKDHDHHNTILSDDVETRMIVEDASLWKCMAFVEKEVQTTQWIIFDGTEASASNIVFFNDQEESELPISYPNPFLTMKHSMVQIPFRLDEPGLVRVEVFNMLGRLLFESEKYINDSGLQITDWNGHDNRGSPVSSGIYLYIVTSGKKIIRKEKFAVVR